jgi:hypothetical protein
MLLLLVKRVLEGKDRVLRDSRSQIAVHRVNRQLIVYRYGGVQFWYDLDTGLRQFCMTTNAEVRAYNQILQLIKSEDQFIKSGPIVFYKTGDKLWRSCEWKTNLEAK